MADEKSNNTEEQPKKGLPVKTIAVIAGVLLMEALTVVGVLMFSGGPEEVKAEGDLGKLVNDDAKDVEILVVAAKFQNARQGKIFQYDTEVFIVGKKKYEEKLTEAVKTKSAQIRTEIDAIFGRAEPNHLLAADRTTIARQVTAVLEKLLGEDEEGKPLVRKVLIPKCIQYSF